MDQSHLITHNDTHSTIKKTHTFLILNIVAMAIILIGGVGWIIYAHSSNKWPYEPYVRKSGPHGSVRMADFIKKHQANATTPATDASPAVDTGDTPAVQT